MIAPGDYLRLRREAAGLSLDELALRFDTIPHWPARDRAEWLKAIENGAAALRPGTAVALRWFFRFDPLVLNALIEIAEGLDIHPPRICRRCGCSEWDACPEPGRRAGGGCAWASLNPELCSRCASEGELQAAPDAAPARCPRPDVAIGGSKE